MDTAKQNHRVMEELVSVIVPIYNVERYVRRCIDSICCQTYPRLEIILVDDGSPDGCGAICDEYAIRDSRVKVIHKKNGGLSDARNAGLDAARGQYISFVDGDDYIKPRMYEIMLDKLKNTDADLAICALLAVDEQGGVLEDQRIPMPDSDMLLTRKDAFEQLTGKNLLCFVVACNRLYRNRLFYELRFPKGRVHEDEFTAHYIYWQCKRVAFLCEPLYCYVQRPESIMRQKYSIKHLDGVEALLDRASFALDKKMYEQASFSCRRALDILSDGYRRLDRRDPAARQRIKELRLQLLKLYPRIMTSPGSIWGKMVLSSFVPHIRCYLAAKALCLKLGLLS